MLPSSSLDVAKLSKHQRESRQDPELWSCVDPGAVHDHPVWTPDPSVPRQACLTMEFLVPVHRLAVQWQRTWIEVPDTGSTRVVGRGEVCDLARRVLTEHPLVFEALVAGDMFTVPWADVVSCWSSLSLMATSQLDHIFLCHVLCLLDIPTPAEVFANASRSPLDVHVTGAHLCREQRASHQARVTRVVWAMGSEAGLAKIVSDLVHVDCVPTSHGAPTTRTTEIKRQFVQTRKKWNVFVTRILYLIYHGGALQPLSKKQAGEDMGMIEKMQHQLSPLKEWWGIVVTSGWGRLCRTLLSSRISPSPPVQLSRSSGEHRLPVAILANHRMMACPDHTLMVDELRVQGTHARTTVVLASCTDCARVLFWGLRALWGRAAGPSLVLLVSDQVVSTSPEKVRWGSAVVQHFREGESVASWTETTGLSVHGLWATTDTIIVSTVGFDPLRVSLPWIDRLVWCADTELHEDPVSINIVRGWVGDSSLPVDVVTVSVPMD